MDKKNLQLNKTEEELARIKDEAERVRAKRIELMLRLKQAGFSSKKIGEIYGCRRQYVDQLLTGAK